MVKIAVLGHGVVGSGVVEVLHKNAASIAKKAGQELEVTRILDLREFPALPYAGLFTKEFQEILDDAEIQVVAEVMGGIHPACDFVKQCLEAGKSVVTSNKELVAARGAELLATAAANNVNFLFEASVGGGIPIIRPLHQCLAANEIDEIAGILNGTTNFILTKMIRESMSFADALTIAQELGYAEKDPTADVEGHDSCRKICILASLAFGSHVYPDNVHTEGITKITLEDVRYAEDADCVIKLIGRAKRLSNDSFSLLVSPALLPRESQLAGIDDVFNGILVKGDATGEVVFYGRGAGKLPTASAVVGDIIDCVKANGTIGSLHWTDSTENNVADYLAQPTRLYVRCTGSESGARALADIGSRMGTVTMLTRKGQPENEFAFLTGEEEEGALRQKLRSLEEKGVKVLSAIRMLEL